MRNNDRFEMQKPKFESEQEKVVRNINSFPTTFLDVIHRIHSQIGLASLPTQISHLNSQICLFSQQQKSSDDFSSLLSAW